MGALISLLGSDRGCLGARSSKDVIMLLLMETKRATICRVLALTHVESLRKQWRCTMDPAVV
jgi:hypothetical protein